MSSGLSFADALTNGYAAAPIGDARSWAVSDRVASDPRSMIEARSSDRASARKATPVRTPSTRSEPAFRGPTPPMPESWGAPAIQTYMAAFPEAAVSTPMAMTAGGPTAAPARPVGGGWPSVSSVVNGVLGGATQSGEGLLDTLRNAGTLTRGFLDGSMDTRTPGAVESAFDAASLASPGAVPKGGVVAGAAKAAIDPVEAIRLSLAKHFDNPSFGLPPGRPGPEADAAIANLRAGVDRFTGTPSYSAPTRGERQAADDAIEAIRLGLERHFQTEAPATFSNLASSYMNRR